MENKDIPYYLIAFAVFMLLKFAFVHVNNSDLFFLLKPTNKLINLLTGSQFIYQSKSGYYYPDLNILIDKSCSGFNYWALCFLIVTYPTVRYFNRKFLKAMVIPFALIGAYLFTLFANTCRIFASIVVQNQTNHILPNHQHLIHEVTGITTNLTFLILAYIIIEKLITLKPHHEKLA